MTFELNLTTLLQSRRNIEYKYSITIRQKKIQLQDLKANLNKCLDLTL